MERFFDLVLPPEISTLDLSTIVDENKLLHLHPHWFVDQAERRDNGLFATLRDYATEREFSLGLHLDHSAAQDDPEDSTIFMRVTLFDFNIRELLFFSTGNQTRLRIRYTGESPDDQLEQDILLWTRAIQEYLRLYTATTPRTLFFRLLMNKALLQMNPSQRKISIMLTKITVIELVVILILVMGYAYFIK